MLLCFRCGLLHTAYEILSWAQRWATTITTLGGLLSPLITSPFPFQRADLGAGAGLFSGLTRVLIFQAIVDEGFLHGLEYR